jgi:hypothetical protein
VQIEEKSQAALRRQNSKFEELSQFFQRAFHNEKLSQQHPCQRPQKVQLLMISV